MAEHKARLAAETGEAAPAEEPAETPLHKMRLEMLARDLRHMISHEQRQKLLERARLEKERKEKEEAEKKRLEEEARLKAELEALAKEEEEFKAKNPGWTVYKPKMDLYGKGDVK